MWIVSRRASSLFSRGVERSETPGNRCKIRGFRRNHLGAREMIPCRETRGGEPAVLGYRCAQPPAKFGFSLWEKSCQRAVVSFQFLDFSCQRVAVGAYGRTPALLGWMAGELPLAPTTACESARRGSSGLSARRGPTCRLRHAHCQHGRTGSSAIRAHPSRRRWRSPRQTSPASPPRSCIELTRNSRHYLFRNRLSCGKYAA